MDRQPKTEKSDDQLIADRTADLIAYQDAAYAERYKQLVDKVTRAEREKAKGMTGLTRAVATYAYKLMAYKDEYEVARLQTSPELKEKLASAFEGDYKIRYHLSPPIFAKKDPISGRPRKYEFGGWITPLFKLMAAMKGLRGTGFDIFGYTAERKMERGLITQYEGVVDRLITGLSPENHALAINIASLPDKIRGYGYIKEDSVRSTLAELETLLGQYENPTTASLAAE